MKMKQIDRAFFPARLLVLALTLLLAAGAAFANASAVEGEHVDGEVLVMLELPSSVSSATGEAFEAGLFSSAQSVATSIGAQAVKTYGAIAAATGRNVVHMRGDGRTTEQLLAALNGRPGVLGAAPNYISHATKEPDDPGYNLLWGMKKINAPQAWDVTTGDRSVIVAVIDTGIGYTHSDLADNIITDKDGNKGFNAIDGNSDPMDDESHGTHVAGTIGAVGNNSADVVGVNWEVGLLGVKVLNDKGSGSTDQIIAGLDYVLAQKNKGLNIKVANMSLGGWMSPIKKPETDPYGAAFKALSDAGIVVVVAAGNEGQNLDKPTMKDHPYYGDLRKKLCYPACFRFANTITVASIKEDEKRSDFSNYSPIYVDLGAPGSNILSTKLGGGTATGSGTSMAAPHVAGAAALLAAEYPTESAALIKARILRRAAANADLNGKVAFDGHLDLAAAITGSAPAPVDPIPVPTPEPTPTPTPEPVKKVTGVSLDLTDLRLKLSMSGTITADVTPKDATDKTVTFTSSNPKVADCSSDPSEQTAVILGRSIGNAVITVRTNDGGFTADCAVNVSDISGGGSGCSTGGVGGTAAALIMLAAPLALFLRRGNR